MPKLELFKVYSGSEFNLLTHNMIFIKFFKDSDIHHDFQFRNGLNKDTRYFQPNGECTSGGFYFTDLDNIQHWCGHGPYMRRVLIPNDAQVYIEKSKYKADKLILEERYFTPDHPLLQEMVSKMPTLLKYITWARPLKSISVVYNNPADYQHVDNSYPEVKMIAVMRDWRMLRYIKNPTEAMCIVALRQSRDAFWLIMNIPMAQKCWKFVYEEIPLPNLKANPSKL